MLRTINRLRGENTTFLLYCENKFESVKMMIGNLFRCYNTRLQSFGLLSPVLGLRSFGPEVLMSWYPDVLLSQLIKRRKCLVFSVEHFLVVEDIEADLTRFGRQVAERNGKARHGTIAPIGFELVEVK